MKFLKLTRGKENRTVLLNSAKIVYFYSGKNSKTKNIFTVVQTTEFGHNEAFYVNETIVEIEELLRKSGVEII